MSGCPPWPHDQALTSPRGGAPTPRRRTLSFSIEEEDGRARCDTIHALVDCATSFILSWELTETENATATRNLILQAVQTYGVFDKLYTDNCADFTSHGVAGSAGHRFRKTARNQ
jgi:transposase InsO family protein